MIAPIPVVSISTFFAPGCCTGSVNPSCQKPKKTMFVLFWTENIVGTLFLVYPPTMFHCFSQPGYVLVPSHLIAILYEESGTFRVPSRNPEFDASIAIACVAPVSPVALSSKILPFLGTT